MLLAELEIWHTRPAVPTRRVALGHLVLPVDPAPGFGGLLLGAVVAQHLPGVDDDLVPDVRRLIDQVERGERIVQPRLRHRYQVDRHGLSLSRHRLLGEGDDIQFDFAATGSDLAQVLGAMLRGRAPRHRRSPTSSHRCCARRCVGGGRSARRSSPTSPARRRTSWRRWPTRWRGRSTCSGFRHGAIDRRRGGHGALPDPHARRASRPRW